MNIIKKWYYKGQIPKEGENVWVDDTMFSHIIFVGFIIFVLLLAFHGHQREKHKYELNKSSYQECLQENKRYECYLMFK